MLVVKVTLEDYFLQRQKKANTKIGVTMRWQKSLENWKRSCHYS